MICASPVNNGKFLEGTCKLGPEETFRTRHSLNNILGNNSIIVAAWDVSPIII